LPLDPKVRRFEPGQGNGFFGRIARGLWWTNQEFSSADIIPPWFSLLIYPLEEEQ
jgi:hypothetical protein